MTIPTPPWLHHIPPADRRHAWRRYLLKTAALIATPDGQLRSLERAVGVSQGALSVFMRKKMPVRLAEKVEGATNGLVRASQLVDVE